MSKTTKTTSKPMILWDRNGRTRGSVQVIRTEDGSLIVSRSDINGEFDRITGFRTVKQAIVEAKCYAG